MFSSQTSLFSHLGLKRKITALLTMLAAIACIIILFSASTAQASHVGPQLYIIGTIFDLEDALNCKDMASVEAGKTALMNSDQDEWYKAYTQKGCYGGGNVEFMKQIGDSFDTQPFGTLRMVRVKRDDGVVTIAIVRSEIMTQTVYDLSRALIVGKKPSIPGFFLCNSTKDVLAILEQIREVTKQTTPDPVGNEYERRGCTGMVTEDSMVVEGQVGEVATSFSGNSWRAVRISRSGAPDVFALVQNRMVLTAAQADNMRKANEAKQ